MPVAWQRGKNQEYIQGDPSGMATTASSTALEGYSTAVCSTFESDDTNNGTQAIADRDGNHLRSREENEEGYFVDSDSSRSENMSLTHSHIPTPRKQQQLQLQLQQQQQQQQQYHHHHHHHRHESISSRSFFRRRNSKNLSSSLVRDRRRRLQPHQAALRLYSNPPNHNIPMGWLLRHSVGGLVDSVSYSVVANLTNWLLQKSLIGDKRRQVFRIPRCLGNTASPINVRSIEYKMSNENPSYYAKLKQNMSQEKKLVHGVNDQFVVPSLINDADHKSLTGKDSMMQLVPTKKIKPDKKSHFQTSARVESEAAVANVHWALTLMEWVALVPMVLIGLSLLYIVAMGLFNDVHDILRGVIPANTPPGDNPFGPEQQPTPTDNDNASLCCPFHN